MIIIKTKQKSRTHEKNSWGEARVEKWNHKICAFDVVHSSLSTSENKNTYIHTWRDKSTFKCNHLKWAIRFCGGGDLILFPLAVKSSQSTNPRVIIQTKVTKVIL